MIKMWCVFLHASCHPSQRVFSGGPLSSCFRVLLFFTFLFFGGVLFVLLVPKGGAGPVGLKEDRFHGPQSPCSSPQTVGAAPGPAFLTKCQKNLFVQLFTDVSKTVNALARERSSRKEGGFPTKTKVRQRWRTFGGKTVLRT